MARARLNVAQASLIPGFEIDETPAILGETFDAKADGERLKSQQRRVEELMSDGEPRTLLEIAVQLRKLYPHTHFPEASLSARLRDMRRAGYVIERTRKSPKSCQWLYSAIKPRPCDFIHGAGCSLSDGEIHGAYQLLGQVSQVMQANEVTA